jgi:hypothetical protein
MGVKHGCPQSRVRVFENWVLRRAFGPNRDEVTGEWRNYVMRTLMICTPLTKYYSGDRTKKVMVTACSMYGGKGVVHKGFW